MYRRLLPVWLTAATLLAGCGSKTTAPTPIVETPPAPQPPTPQPPNPPAPVPILGITRILAFGDSMTEGTTSPPASPSALTPGLPQSYPFKLQDLMTARYTTQSIVILNDGRGGEPVRDPTARSRFNADLSDARPDLILLMDGANDMLGLRGVTGAALSDGITSTVNAMEDLVRDATGRGIRVWVLTLPPENPSGSRGGAASFLGRYNDGLKVMAAKKGAQILDINTLLPLSFVGQDGLHLTEAGHQRLAEILRDAIAEAFDVKS